MILDHQTVVLVRDLPALGLRRGDVGAVVHVYGDGAGVEVEFVAGDGRTLGVETLEPGAVRPLGADEILHARPVAA